MNLWIISFRFLIFSIILDAMVICVVDSNKITIMKGKKILRSIQIVKFGETVILPCVQDHDIGESTAGTDYVWALRDKDDDSIIPISFNENIILQNDFFRYQVNGNRSLIVHNFMPSNPFLYECHLATGPFITHYSSRISRLEQTKNQ